ncbi:hypothetical protein PISMIDRAFT_686078 [Pisolithus microcarpus 441]|uniref:Uncharacterized protein n=1 Tax=Pisolithus microcarpus 441 TaxID=765257 RepID=A0A0C9YJ36_9AGAM|nr:hypothetical protein PISMIDRAFT_686078 [Pisolithus microcarpus 441]
MEIPAIDDTNASDNHISPLAPAERDMAYLLVVRPRIEYYVATPYRPNRIFRPLSLQHRSQPCLFVVRSDLFRVRS